MRIKGFVYGDRKDSINEKPQKVSRIAVVARGQRKEGLGNLWLSLSLSWKLLIL